MNVDQGREVISARIAFGAISLQKSESLSDKDIVRSIQENPYVQYYLGLHEFHPELLFNSLMIVHFRKRFPVEFIAKVNERIAPRKWPEENWNIEHNDKNDGTGSGNYEDQDEAEEQGDKKNSGALILYSTLARQISIIQRILTFRTNLGNTWKMQSDVSGHMSHMKVRNTCCHITGKMREWCFLTLPNQKSRQRRNCKKVLVHCWIT